MTTAFIIFCVVVVFQLLRIEHHLAYIRQHAETLDWRAQRVYPLLKHEREVVERYDEDLARRGAS